MPYRAPSYMRMLRARALKESWKLRLTCSREREGWRAQARCKGRTNAYFPDGGTRPHLACDGCPVRLDCLAACWKMERDVDPRFWFGTYGGLSPSDRRAAVKL